MKVYIVTTFVQDKPTSHVYGAYSSYQAAYSVERDIRRFYSRIYGEDEKDNIMVWIEEAEIEDY